VGGFKAFIAPLLIFVGGFLIILFVFVFYPSMQTVSSASVAQIGPTQMSSFTMLSWAMTSWPLLLFFGLVFVILIAAAVAWLRRQ
jgi:disulfide bond formation protein DsbB